jgi:hypothetical protein
MSSRRPGPLRCARRATAAMAALAGALALSAPVASAANSEITGTVTGPSDEPLGGICVSADDGIHPRSNTVTEPGGTYALAAEPGNGYVVQFDDCGTGAYVTEFFDNVTDSNLAQPVTVSATAETPGIDAKLAAAPTDTVDPETSIESGPPDPSTDPVVTFGFSSNEPAATFKCRLDGAPAQDCSSPTQYGPLSDGPHEFSVYAIDPTGNFDHTPATQDFEINSTAPNTIIDSGPSGTVATRNVSFTFHSTKAPASFICKLDGNSQPCSSPQFYSNLANGPHVFSVTASDDAGNGDLTPAQQSFYVDVAGTPDTDPPDTTIQAGPGDGETISTTSASFDFTSDELGSSFECKLDDGAFEACDPPKVLTDLANGPHTFYVQARDPAGNLELVPASRSFTVDTAPDTTPPETTILSGPADGSTIAQNSATFSFDSDDPNASFECSLDGEAFSNCSSPRTYSGLADGDHEFRVQATDAAANTDLTPATSDFTVDTTLPPDTTAPDTTIQTGPADGETITQTSATITFDSTEPGSTFVCKLDNGAFAACNSPAQLSGLSDGAHTFSVKATDVAGNHDLSADSRTFTVDTTPPDTTIQTGPSGTIPQSSAGFTFTSNEAGDFECRLDAGAFELCSSPQDLTGLSDGSHTFQVRATDVAGHQDPSPASRTFTVDTTAPQTTILSGPSGDTISASSTTFSFTSSESGSAFQCKVDAGSYSPCTSPATLTGLADGSHSFSVRAVDAAGNTDATPAGATFTVQTTTTQPPPTSDPECTAAHSRLASAQKALDKAKAKVKKAKSRAAKKKAKKSLKAAKTKVKSAQSAVAAAC